VAQKQPSCDCLYLLAIPPDNYYINLRVFNLPPSRPVQDLLDRAGGRSDLLVHFTVATGYQLHAWNRPAAELFGLDPACAPTAPVPWDQLPGFLAQYLAQALPLVTGAPEEAMPELAHPSRTGLRYFAKVFYHGVAAADGGDEQHWYLFCFQDAVNWLDQAHGAVNQKKLETIGELASGVAHDFNNLIMGIQSNAEAMLTQPSMTPQARDGLINIIRACTTGASLTRSLLGYAKRQPLTLTPFNLIDLVQDVTRIAGVASGKYRIALGKELQELSEPILVVGSYSSLSHCVLNLIKNAREAMPDGGTVHVLWEGDDATARITVRDHGTGIAEQDLARIFEPFFSTKKQGTGLGLAMVRGILTQHSGTVEIRSTLGMGTSVSLAWPRGAGVAMPGPRDSADGNRATQRIYLRSQNVIPQGRQLTDPQFLIYVIDDDDLVREGLCSLLQHLGHRTESFRHPEVALQTLLAAHPQPAVVIVDYNMPGMNGTQFIGRYSTAGSGAGPKPETQILLMSGLPPSHFDDFMSGWAFWKSRSAWKLSARNWTTCRATGSSPAIWLTWCRRRRRRCRASSPRASRPRWIFPT
jgi:signal transduction histidine kinase/CheY-like chemotaxis protein